MKAAAQTKERAERAIGNATKAKHAHSILYGTGHCACGECKRILAYHYGELIASVTICDVCGDDTLTDDELTTIY